MHELIKYVPLLPFIGFLILGLFGKYFKKEAIIGTIGSGTVFGSLIISLIIFFDFMGKGHEKPLLVPVYKWIETGALNINVSYQVDQLSILFSLIVTGVGFLIHVYSIGYMRGDRSYYRFFSYMNLFIFMMLNLVLADNLLFTFLGWEGVGLCSYLLIGFWYDRNFEKSTTSAAGLKAFIVNRIGDVGFLLGMFLIYLFFNSLKFTEVFSRAISIGAPEYIFTLITLFLF